MKDVNDVLSLNLRLLRIIQAAMAAESDNQGQRYQRFKQTLAETEKKELVEALGFDPANISVDKLKQVYELANLIYEDQLTRIILTQFVKDYADAQHSLEWSEFSGGAAFEVILTALLAIATGGVGAIASLGAKAKKISQLKRLGALFSELAERLKGLPKDKQLSLRKLKEIEEYKAQKAQKPAVEQEKVGGAAIANDDKIRNEDAALNNTPNSTAQQVVNISKPKLFPQEVDWNNSGPNGLQVKDPRDFAVGKIMYESLLNKGLEPDLALTISRELLESGMNEPQIIKLKPGDKMYKVVPKDGGPPGDHSPYFMTKEMLDELPGEASEAASILGLPQAPEAFDIYSITAKTEIEVFQSEIAPFSVNGGEYLRSGGGTQTLVTNRSQFTAPSLSDN